MNNDIFEFLQNGQMILRNDTHISVWAKEHQNIVSDPYLFKFLQPHLNDVACIWDIGANIGDHTRAYLDMGKTVYAFEPNPHAYACLVHNCPDSHNYNLAVSSKKGKLSFEQTANVGASKISKNGTVYVDAVTLDSMKLPKPDFVKIDIEGWEVHALRGMKKTLSKHKPKLFIEINSGALSANGHSLNDVLVIISELGYDHVERYPIGSAETDLQYDILIY